MKLQKRLAGLMSITILITNRIPIMGQINMGKNTIQDTHIISVTTESQIASTTESSLEISTSNGTRRNDWNIIMETDTNIVLGEYKGTSKDIIIPTELEGKQIVFKFSNLELPDEMTSLTVREENGRKIKIDDLRWAFSGKTALRSVDLSGLDVSSVTSMIYMFNGCNSLKEIEGMSNWNTSAVTDMGEMFRGCTSLTDLTGLENWDISSVTEMSGMFSGCTLLTDLTGLENWDTSSVIHMSGMFTECTSLTDLTGLENWDTSSVTHISMFTECTSLTDLTALSNWDTSSVTNMGVMFMDCTSLTDLTGLENWDTSSVTDMSHMFSGCNSLIDLTELENWDTSSLTEMTAMFRECTSLTDLIGLENWDTSLVTHIPSIFYKCSSLEEISGIADWDTSSIINMSQAFSDCKMLEIVDLSKWKTPALEYMNFMFNGSSSLKVIDLSGFSLDNCDKYLAVFAAYTPTPLLVVAKDDKLKNYDYIKDNRIPSGPIFNANGGEFLDSTIEKQSEKVFVLEDITESIIDSIIDKAKDSIETPIRMGQIFDTWSLNKTGIARTGLKLDLYNKLNQSYYALWKTGGSPVNTPPTIIAMDKEILVGDKFNPLQGVKAFDKEDGDITLSDVNIIRNEVSVNIPGTYEVEYQVTDSQGATAIKVIQVKVHQKLVGMNQVPTISATDKEIVQGTVFDPLKGVKAYDVEDGDLTSKVTIETNTVDVNVPGEYDVTYKVVDSQGASMVKAIKVIVKPKLVILNQVPTVEMHTKEFMVGQEIRPSEYIIIKDDGDISKVTVKVTSTIPYDIKNQKEYFKKAGKYKLTYTVTDELGASSSQTFDIIVKEKSEPSNPNKPSEGGSSSGGTNNKPNEDDFFGTGALQHIKYVEGYEDGTFKADVGITRGEFVMMLARILFEGGKLPTASVQFKDVSNTYFAKDAINYFATIGVVEGYEDETFRARQPITRAEIATIMKRILVLENVIDTYRIYKDVQIGHWAYDAIQEVAYKGYLVGYENDEFRPSASITRAEAVAGLNRIYRVPCNKEDINYKIKFKDISSDYWAYEDILKSSITHEHEEAKRH